MQTNTGVLQATNATITSINSINIQTSNIVASNIVAPNIVASNITINNIFGPGLTNALIMNSNAFGQNAVAVYTSSIVASGYLSFNELGYQGQQQDLFNTNLVASLTGMYLYGTDTANLLYYNFSPLGALIASPINATGAPFSAITNNGNIIVASRANGVNPFTYSYDGLNFYPGVASINSSGKMCCITYNNSNLWVATNSTNSGLTNSILFSSNGKN